MPMWMWICMERWACVCRVWKVCNKLGRENKIWIRSRCRRMKVEICEEIGDI